MMQCKCLDCSAERAEPPVIMVDATPVLERPAYLDPAIPPTLTGLRIDHQIDAGDVIAAIVKDAAGQMLGYIAQSEVDRLKSLPSAEEIRATVEQIRELFGGVTDAARAAISARGFMANISLPTVTLPAPTPLWSQLMGDLTDSLSRNVEAGLINAYSFGRGCSAGPVLFDELPAPALPDDLANVTAVDLIRQHNRRQGVWTAGPQ